MRFQLSIHSFINFLYHPNLIGLCLNLVSFCLCYELKALFQPIILMLEKTWDLEQLLLDTIFEESVKLFDLYGPVRRFYVYRTHSMLRDLGYELRRHRVQGGPRLPSGQLRLLGPRCAQALGWVVTRRVPRLISSAECSVDGLNSSSGQWAPGLFQGRANRRVTSSVSCPRSAGR